MLYKPKFLSPSATGDVKYLEKIEPTSFKFNLYDNTQTYTADEDYCIYNNKPYKCKTTISTAEDWNASHWEEVTSGTGYQAYLDECYEFSCLCDGNTKVTGGMATFTTGRSYNVTFNINNSNQIINNSSTRALETSIVGDYIGTQNKYITLGDLTCTYNNINITIPEYNSKLEYIYKVYLIVASVRAAYHDDQYRCEWKNISAGDKIPMTAIIVPNWQRVSGSTVYYLNGITFKNLRSENLYPLSWSRGYASGNAYFRISGIELQIFEDSKQLPLTIGADTYPINSEGDYTKYSWLFPAAEYNSLFGVIETDVNWNIELYSVTNTVTSSTELSRLIHHPSLEYTVTKSNDTAVAPSDDVYNIDGTVNIVVTNTNFPKPIQHYYWELYDDHDNLLYTADKVFSGDIRWSYDSFINNTNYKMKVYIQDSELYIYTDTINLRCAYEEIPISANISLTPLEFDTGVLIQWDEFSAYAAQGDIPEYKQYIIRSSNSDLYQVQTAHITSPLSLMDLHTSTKGFYFSGNFTESVYTKPIITVNVNETYTITVVKKDNNTLRFTTNLLSSSDYPPVDIPISDNCWYIFYYRFSDHAIFIYELNYDSAGTIASSAGLGAHYNYVQAFDDQTDTPTNRNALGVQGIYSSTVIPGQEYVNSEIASVPIESYSITSAQINNCECNYFYIADNNDDGALIDTLGPALYYTPTWYWQYNGFVVNQQTPAWERTGSGSYIGQCCLNFISHYPDEEGDDITENVNRLIAGDPSFSNNITRIDIYRQRASSTLKEKVCSLYADTQGTITNQIVDYGTISGETYTYDVIPVIEDASYYTPPSEPLEIDWDRWMLFTATEIGKNQYEVDDIFIFSLNINSGQMSNNSGNAAINNFTAYPRIQRTTSNYWSGSLSGLMGYLDTNDHNYIQNDHQLRALKTLSLSDKPKFLKDRDGHLWRVELTGPVIIDNTDNLCFDLKTKTINWVEVGDASNIELAIREQKTAEWLLTLDGYSHPMVEYQWQNDATWNSGLYWTNNFGR